MGLGELLRDLRDVFPPELWWPFFHGLSLLGYLLLGFVTVRSGSNRAYWLCLWGALFAFRWPDLAHPLSLGHDESAALAGALKLSIDPLFFRSVDGTTNGPCFFFLPLVPSLIGLQTDYSSARLMGLLEMGGMLTALALACRCRFGERAWREVGLAGLTLVGTAHLVDLHTYGSEMLPLCLLSISLWLLAKLSEAPNLRLAGLFGLSLGFGLTVKLQVALVGCYVGVTGLALVRRQPKLLAAITLGAMLPLGLEVLVLCLFGEGWTFFKSYLQGNFHYASVIREFGNPSVFAKVSLYRKLVYLTPAFVGSVDQRNFFLGLGLLTGLVLAKWRPQVWSPFWWGTGLLFLSLLSTVTPGSSYPHHKWFLMWGGVCYLATLVGASSVPRTAVLLLCVALQWWGKLPGNLDEFGSPTVAYQVCHSNALVGRPEQASIDQIEQMIRQLSPANGPLAVWGFSPELYVDTGRFMATRDFITERQMEPRFDRDYFQERFISDLQTSRPAVFVDTVGLFAHLDRSQFGIEVFPTINDYVVKNYEMVANVGPGRVWKRKASP